MDACKIVDIAVLADSAKRTLSDFMNPTKQGSYINSFEEHFMLHRMVDNNSRFHSTVTHKLAIYKLHEPCRVHMNDVLSIFTFRIAKSPL